MNITNKNEPTNIVDQSFKIDCPHCELPSGISVVSIPRFELLKRYLPPEVIIGYRCDNCNGSIAARLSVDYSKLGNHQVRFDPESFRQLELPSERYEYRYLPDTVAEDFKEALICYSSACFNAFAAMCRRSVQSTLTELGADGKSKVMQQLDDAKVGTEMDEGTYEILNQIIIAGHDGAHPNLPKLDQDRAAILLELMKDVLYQLFVRKKKLAEAIAMRKQTIQSEKHDPLK